VDVEKVAPEIAPAKRLIAVLNQGQALNPEIVGEPIIPISHAPSLRAADEILATVPFEFAASEILDAAQKYQPNGRNRHIGSLGYLRDRVIDRWEQSQTRAAPSEHVGKPRPPRFKDKLTRGREHLAAFVAASGGDADGNV